MLTEFFYDIGRLLAKMVMKCKMARAPFLEPTSAPTVLFPTCPAPPLRNASNAVRANGLVSTLLKFGDF